MLITLNQKLALSSHSLDWNTIEISDDDTLLAQYGVRIPVVKRVDTHAELGWAFTAEDITQFIAD